MRDTGRIGGGGPLRCLLMRHWRAGRAVRRQNGKSDMAGSVNKVILIGNVGADPEIRRTQDGRPIANLRIATSETWRDRNSGERREKTEWHTVVVFNEGLCKVVEQYVKKGAKLYIEGQLQTRKWQDQTAMTAIRPRSSFRASTRP